MSRERFLLLESFYVSVAYVGVVVVVILWGRRVFLNVKILFLKRIVKERSYPVKHATPHHHSSQISRQVGSHMKLCREPLNPAQTAQQSMELSTSAASAGRSVQSTLAQPMRDRVLPRRTRLGPVQRSRTACDFRAGHADTLAQPGIEHLELIDPRELTLFSTDIPVQVRHLLACAR